VLLLLLQLVLKEFDFLQLGVKLELKVANDETASTHFILKLLVFDLKLNDFCCVEFSFLDLLFEVRLDFL